MRYYTLTTKTSSVRRLGAQVYRRVITSAGVALLIILFATCSGDDVLRGGIYVNFAPSLSLSATAFTIPEVIVYQAIPQGRDSNTNPDYVYRIVNAYAAVDSNANGHIDPDEYNIYELNMNTGGDFWPSATRLGSTDDISMNNGSNSNAEVQYRFGNSGTWSTNWGFVQGNWDEFQVRVVIKTATIGNIVFTNTMIGSTMFGSNIFNTSYAVHTIDPTKNDKDTPVTLNASDQNEDPLSLKVFEGTSTTESDRLKVTYNSNANPNGRLIIIRDSAFDYESEPFITLRIEATDGGKKSSKLVTVTVTDVAGS